jgi:DNA-binding IclR family transcriptional regulator
MQHCPTHKLDKCSKTYVIVDPGEIVMPFNTSRGVKSIEVGTRLLHIMAEVGRPMMLTELARAAGLAPAQVHTYLASFRRAKLVEQNGQAGMYRLGPFAIRLAQVQMHSDALLGPAIRESRELADETGLSTDVLVWIGGRPSIVDVRDGLNNLNIDVKPGQSFSLYKTCSGRALVAFSKRSELMRCLEDDIRAAVAEGHGAREELERRFWIEIAEARKKGYTETVDNPIPGVGSVAAPVFGRDGEVAAVIAIFGPKSLVDISADGPLVKALLSVCRRVSMGPVAVEPA